MPNAPVLTLLTDYGTTDHYVAAVKGVILGICPGVPLVDVTHHIPSFSVEEGAFTLSQAWRTFPAGTVHLAVVDPGVGGTRRALAATVENHFFVAPDNGLLGLVLAEDAVVHEITAEEYFRQPVSRTFHGRDIFGPVAAHLATGIALEKFGPRVEDWFRPGFTAPSRLSRKSWSGSVLKVDHFGNVVTNFAVDRFELHDEEFELQIGLHSVYRTFPSYGFAPVGELFLVAGSSGFWEVSMNQGSAGIVLGVGAGAPLELRS